MKQWRGLFRKEWALGWKVMAIMTVVIAIITVFSVSHVFNGVPENFSTEILSLIETMTMLHVWAGICMYIGSLQQEMKRADIWLHSSASITQLSLGKAIVTCVWLIISLMLSGAIVGFVYYFGGGVLSILEGITFFLSVFVQILQSCLYAMAAGFFYWTIYHYFRSRIGWASIVVTIFLLLVGISLWLVLSLTNIFSSIKELWPIEWSHNFKVFYLMAPVPENASLTMGSLLLYIVVSVLLFCSGSVLFEKKARY